MTEPVWTWSFMLTAVIVPIGLFLVYTGIKRLLDKRDKEDCEKDKKIEELQKAKESLKDAANVRAHETTAEKIEALHDEIIADRANTREVREEIIDQLKIIDATVKLINGSVQACKQEIALHKADTNAHTGD